MEKGKLRKGEKKEGSWCWRKVFGVCVGGWSVPGFYPKFIAQFLVDVLRMSEMGDARRQHHHHEQWTEEV